MPRDKMNWGQSSAVVDSLEKKENKDTIEALNDHLKSNFMAVFFFFFLLFFVSVLCHFPIFFFFPFCQLLLTTPHIHIYINKTKWIKGNKSIVVKHNWRGKCKSKMSI